MRDTCYSLDFTTGDSGGVIFSFGAYFDNNEQVDASKLFARMTGLEIEGGRRHG